MENVVSAKGQNGHGAALAAEPCKPARPSHRQAGDVVGASRRFFDNRFVYAVVSQRSRGLSIGVNLSPDKFCTFDCVYCEVSRNHHPQEVELDLKAVASELKGMLALAAAGRVHELPGYQ